MMPRALYVTLGILLVLVVLSFVCIVAAFATATYFEVGFVNENWPAILYLNTHQTSTDGVTIQRPMQLQTGAWDPTDDIEFDFFFLWQEVVASTPDHPYGDVRSTEIGFWINTRLETRFVFSWRHP